jgi:hypothetical protein
MVYLRKHLSFAEAIANALNFMVSTNIYGEDI